MNQLNKYITNEDQVSPLIIRPTNLGKIEDYNKNRTSQVSINNLLETLQSNSENYFAVSCEERGENENTNYINVASFDHLEHKEEDFFRRLVGYTNPQFHYMNPKKLAALNNQRALQIFEINNGEIHETIKSNTEQIQFFKFNPVFVDLVLIVTGEKLEIWDISTGKSETHSINRGREIVTNADWNHEGNYLTVCSKSESLDDSASARSNATPNSHIYIFDKSLKEFIKFNCKENEKAIILNFKKSKSNDNKLKFEVFTCRTASLNGKTCLQAYIRHVRIFADNTDKSYVKPKNNLHDVEDFPLAGTIFSHYDHLNKALYLGKTHSSHIYCFEFHSFKETIRYSQKIPLESRINSISTAPIVSLHYDDNELIRVIVIDEDEYLWLYSIREAVNANTMIRNGESQTSLEKQSQYFRLNLKQKTTPTHVIAKYHDNEGPDGKKRIISYTIENKEYTRALEARANAGINPRPEIRPPESASAKTFFHRVAQIIYSRFVPKDCRDIIGTVAEVAAQGNLPNAAQINNLLNQNND